MEVVGEGVLDVCFWSVAGIEDLGPTGLLDDGLEVGVGEGAVDEGEQGGAGGDVFIELAGEDAGECRAGPVEEDIQVRGLLQAEGEGQGEMSEVVVNGLEVMRVDPGKQDVAVGACVDQPEAVREVGRLVQE